MNATVLIFLVLYYVVVLGIGMWTMRRGATDDLEGYLLGGREVGPLVTALTLQSTSMSGYMFLGAGSLAYTTGYWSLWFAAGDIGGGVLNLSIIGRRMRKLSQMMGSLTSIEYLEARYQSPVTRLIAASLSVFLLAFYVLAQFIAGGKGMALVTGLDYEWALLIALAIIVLYTLLGGYLAVAYTDFFQSLIMIVGVLWILGAALVHVGGFTAANHRLAEIDPTILSIWGTGLGFGGQWGVVAGAVLVFSAGYMGWPHVVTRHMAMKRPATARLAGAYATAWNLLFVSAPYLVGILAILILPNLDDPELAIFEVAQTLLPPAVTGLVMAAIMAAIMSTADSLLLQTGSIASRDLYERFINPRASEQQMLWVSRACVLGIGDHRVSRCPRRAARGGVRCHLCDVGAGQCVCAGFRRCRLVEEGEHPWCHCVDGCGSGDVGSVGACGPGGDHNARACDGGPHCLDGGHHRREPCDAATLTGAAHVLAAMEETARVGPIPETLIAMSDFALRPEAEEIESMLREEEEAQ